jgi:hypothetical protein
MKTFKQFIAEEPANTVKMKDFLVDACLPLIRELATDLYELPMYRGVSLGGGKEINIIEFGPNYTTVDGFVKTVRKDRKPLDTHPQISKMIDDVFEKQFGWRPRQEGLFVFGKLKRSQAREFGTLCQIFPMGEFNYIHSSKIEDLTSTLDGLLKTAGIRSIHKKQDYNSSELKAIRTMLDTEIPKMDYSDDHLWEALDNKGEIIIDCKQYLAVQQ